MKFATYTEKNNPSSRYGFLVNNRVVDITRAAQWISENNNDNHFLSLPHSLKESLVNWDHNYSILKKLENEISNIDIVKKICSIFR